MRRPWPVLICAACLNISAGLAIFGLLSVLFFPMTDMDWPSRLAVALGAALIAGLTLLAAGGLWRMRRWGVVLALLLVLLGLVADIIAVAMGARHVSLLGPLISVVLTVGAARSWNQMSWAPLRIGETLD